MQNAEWIARTPTRAARTCDRPCRAIPHSAFPIPHSIMKRRQPRATRETSAGGGRVRGAPPPEVGPPPLLLNRRSHKNWGLPKGHLGPDAPPARAARRPAAEET